MSLPALQQLRLHHPEARITILARPWVAALYAREPFCDHLISYEGGIGARFSTAVKLRRINFDCALLLQNAFEAAAVACLAGIPIRIGYSRDARGWLLTRSIPVPEKNEIPNHQRFYYLELLRRAGLIEHYSLTDPIKLTGANAAVEAGHNRLRRLVSATSAIGVSPGAAYGGAKCWLPERFAQSAIQIARDSQSAVLILGSQSEHELCSQVQNLVNAAGIEAINLAGKTTLRDLIEIAAACRIILTNDSGVMHIGSALGVPTVTVFGATDEEATGPTGPLARIVRQPVECSPCLLRECPIDHRCMTRVDVDMVTRTAFEVLHEA